MQSKQDLIHEVHRLERENRHLREQLTAKVTPNITKTPGLVCQACGNLICIEVASNEYVEICSRDVECVSFIPRHD